METSFFMQEVKRLQNRFGNHFDSELVKLIWIEVRDLESKDFKSIVDLCIGEFKIEYPPKLSHFREFAAERRKITHQNQVRQAKNWIFSQDYKDHEKERNKSSEDGLKKALDEVGAKSLLDAILKKRSNHHGE